MQRNWPSIIGISGAISSEKDTLTLALCSSNKNYTHKKFATKLREVAAIITGIDASSMLSREDKSQLISKKILRVIQSPDLVSPRLIKATKEILAISPDNKTIESIAEVLSYFPMDGLPTIGRLLQILGTECFRKYLGSNIWVEALFAEWETTGCKPIIISDVRFTNEAEAIKARNGFIFQIKRYSKNQKSHKANILSDR